MLLHEKKSFGIGQPPEWIQEIILKAIAKTPELRFQSMLEFNQAIKSEGKDATATTFYYRAAQP